MKVVCVDPRTDPLWRSLVEKTESSVFHSPSWIRVLTDTYSWQASAYVLVDDARGGRAVGVAESEQRLGTASEMRLKVRKYTYGLRAQRYSFFRKIWHGVVAAQRGVLRLAMHGEKSVGGDFCRAW